MRRMPHTAVLHVEPGPRGCWVVRREGEPVPVSKHGDAEEATEAAIHRAELECAVRVIVHDLYSCVRHVVPSRAGST